MIDAPLEKGAAPLGKGAASLGKGAAPLEKVVAPLEARHLWKRMCFTLSDPWERARKELL